MIATRQSWSNLQSLPVQRSLLSLQREFTEQEYACICEGLIPRSMEDKWFMFIEEDTLYIHRSWTGYCIYQISFIQRDAMYSVDEAFVNRDPNQYVGVDDQYDEKLLMFLIESLLLGGHSSLPLAAHVPAGIATELHLHHVVGAGHQEKEMSMELSILGGLKWLWQWLLWLIKN